MTDATPPPPDDERTDEPVDEHAPDPFAGPEWSEGRRRRVRTSPDQVRRRVHGRSRKRLRRVLLIGGGFVVLIIAAVGWLAYSAAQARTELTQVRADVAALRTDIANGDLDAAKATVASLRTHAARAHDLTTGPVWAVASGVPYLGEPLRTARVISASVDRIADQALSPLVEASSALTSTSLRDAKGTIDLAPIERGAKVIGPATTVLEQSLQSVTAASGSTWSGSVNQARSDLIKQLPPLLKIVQNADLAARTVPELLGADGPRSYFVGFLNEAELRGLGGLPGAFAILKADHGKITFTRFESDSELLNTGSGVSFGFDYDSLYSLVPGSTGDYLQSDASPHFPYAAQIWAGMWKQKTGQQLDGAIALDPTALSYLLGASGPATLADGTQVSASNVVALTQQTAYDRFGDDQDKRKQFLLDIAKAASQRLLQSQVNPAQLIRAATRAVVEHRLLLWTRDARTEQTLGDTPITGTVPITPQPYLGLAINNVGVNKLDYYLHASLTRTTTSCSATTRDVTVTLTLRNDAPKNLAKYVIGAGGTPRFPSAGVNESYLQIMASENSTVVGAATLNGKPLNIQTGTLISRPVFGFLVLIPRNTPQVIVLHLREPRVDSPLLTRLQPMINPVQFQAGTTDCSS